MSDKIPTSMKHKKRMNRSRSTFALIELLAMLFLLTGSLSAADFLLVDQGKPKAQILFETAPDPDVKTQVTKFNSYIKKITDTDQ